MNSGNSTSRKFTSSCKVALTGIILAVRTERNIQIQSLIGILVIIAGFILKINSMEWLIVSVLFAVVISTELINTAVEKLCNFVQPNTDNEIRIIKDISAGAVLWTSIIAAIAGIMIFVPKILILLTNH